MQEQPGALSAFPLSDVKVNERNESVFWPAKDTVLYSNHNVVHKEFF